MGLSLLESWGVKYMSGVVISLSEGPRVLFWEVGVFYGLTSMSILLSFGVGGLSTALSDFSPRPLMFSYSLFTWSSVIFFSVIFLIFLLS